MAEGDIPNGKKPTEPSEEISDQDIFDMTSLELIFARDLVTFVMRRRIPSWEFSDEYGGPPPVTSFSFRIRKAVLYHLLKEDVNIYFLFARGFKGLPLEYRSFILVTSHVVNSVYPNVRTPNDLLRLVILVAQFAVLGSRKGIHLAPYYAATTIQDLLCQYMNDRALRQSSFYKTMAIHADKMILETPLVPHDLLS